MTSLTSIDGGKKEEELHIGEVLMMYADQLKSKKYSEDFIIQFCGLIVEYDMGHPEYPVYL